MEPLNPQAILEILARQRQRGGYIATLLEFKLGREPTQEEIDAVKMDAELSRRARKLWESMQPWPNRYKFSRRQRLENIMMKRYGVSHELLDKYLDEIEHDCW